GIQVRKFLGLYLNFITIEENQLSRRMHSARHFCAADQMRDFSVVQHELKPLLGIRRIKRQIASSRFKHRQNGHQQLMRSLETYADQHVRPDAALPQQPGQLVCSLIELRVGKAQVSMDECDVIGGAQDLLLKQLNNGWERGIMSSS